MNKDISKTEELIIDESNFDQYFFDVKKNKPKQGQVIVCFESKADFINGQLKKDIVDLLLNNEKGSQFAVNVMERSIGATTQSAICVVKDMLNDLLSGKSRDEVISKDYEFHCRLFYYTWKECVPRNDPRWWSMSLVDSTQEKIDVEKPA